MGGEAVGVGYPMRRNLTMSDRFDILGTVGQFRSHVRKKRTAVTDYDHVISALTNKTGTVKLNCPPHRIATTPKVASDLAQSRAEGVARGERVATLYKADGGTLSTEVSRDQAIHLLSLGATWIGPDHLRPV